jgi:hypothetical protein
MYLYNLKSGENKKVVAILHPQGVNKLEAAGHLAQNTPFQENQRLFADTNSGIATHGL